MVRKRTDALHYTQSVFTAVLNLPEEIKVPLQPEVDVQGLNGSD